MKKYLFGNPILGSAWILCSILISLRSDARPLPGNPAAASKATGCGSFFPALYYLKDTTGKLNEQQALALFKKEAFAPVPPLFFENDESVPGETYWFFLRIVNSGASTLNLALDLQDHEIDTIFCYVYQKDTRSDYYHTGNALPYHSRAIPYEDFAFPVSILPMDTVSCLLRVNTRDYLRKPFRVVSLSRFLHQARSRHEWLAFYCGIIVFVILFNLFLFFSLRDKIHLYYIFYIICVFIVILCHEGLAFAWLYPRTPFLNDSLWPVVQDLGISCSMQVLQLFIGQKRSNSKFYYPVSILKWIALAAGTGHILFYASESAYFDDLYGLLDEALLYGAMLLLIASLVEKIRQGDKAAWVYLSAIVPPVIGGALLNLNGLGLIKFHYLKPDSLTVGIILEVVVLSFALTYRYNLDRRQKYLLQKELAEHQGRHAQQIIETQESERRRIAADLHDDLGSNLAAIKVNFSAFAESAGLHKGEVPEAGYLQIKNMLDKACDDVRAIAHNLMPVNLSDQSYAAIICQYVGILNQSGKIRFYFYQSGNLVRFKHNAEVNIYRILFELMNNIHKHSQATEATVQLIFYEDHLNISVEDNGKGFNPDEVQFSEGTGIKNIRARTGLLGGTVNLDSSYYGTTAILDIPYNRNIPEL